MLELRHNYLVSVIMCVAYSIIFIASLVGNGFVLTVIAKGKFMRTETNIFIGNLAFADLVFTLLCIPFALIANLYTEWPFGEVLCKLVAYFEAVAVSASVNSLVAISIDRCLTINSPIGAMVKARKIKTWITFVWLFPLIIMFPWLLIFSVKSVKPGSKLMICADFWGNKSFSDIYFVFVNLILTYFVPLVIISVCYSIIYKRIQKRQVPGHLCPNQRQSMQYKSKLQIIKMILVVTVTFAVSWLPLYTIFLITKLFGFPKTTYQQKILYVAFPVCQWFGATNVCINPIIYTCFSKKFRSEFKWLIKKMFSTQETHRHVFYIQYQPSSNNVLLSTSQTVETA